MTGNPAPAIINAAQKVHCHDFKDAKPEMIEPTSGPWAVMYMKNPIAMPRCCGLS